MSGGEETTRVSYNTRRSKRLRKETDSKTNVKHQGFDQDESGDEEVPHVQTKKKSATHKSDIKDTNGKDYSQQKTLRRSTRPKKKQVSELSRSTSSSSRSSSKKSSSNGKKDTNSVKSKESQDGGSSQSTSHSMKRKREVSKSSSQVSDISDFDEDIQDHVDDEEWEDTQKRETSKIGLSSKTKKTSLPKKRRGPSLVPIQEDKLSEPDKEFCYILLQLKSDNVSVKVTLDKFLDEFCPSDSDSEKAIVMYGLCQLVTLCIQTAVDNGGIEIETRDLETGDPLQVVDSMARSVSKFATEAYPFIRKDKHSKRLSVRFCDFWKKFAISLPETLTYSGSYLELLFEWLISISKAKRQSFRHTAMMAMYSLLDGLIEVYLLKENQLSIIHRRLETENKKAAKARSSEKIKQFTRDQNDIEKELSLLEQYITLIFEQVFVSRFRDINSVIREASIENLGRWMKSFPPFVHVNHLKYLGWSLNDADSSVRKASLHAIQHAFEKWGHEEPLILFHKRFSKRLLEMLKDVDSSVVACVIDLITLLLRFPNLAFDEEKLDEIPELLWDSAHIVRKAAARHVYESAFSQGSDENGSELQNKVNDMKSLISLFVECAPLSESYSTEEIDSAVEVYVESLWTLIPCFQSWEMYLELLCPSDTRSGLTLADIDAGKYGEPDSLLLRFLLSVARHVSNEYVSSRKASKSKKDLAESLKKSFDTALIPKICDVLSTYQADVSSVCCVLSLIMVIDVSEFSTLVPKSNLEDIVNIIKKLFTTHSSTNFLEICSQTLNHLHKSQSSFQELVSQVLHEIVDSMISNIKQLPDVIETQDSNDENIFSLQSILERSFALISKFELMEYLETFDIFLSCLSKIIDFPEEALIPFSDCVICLFKILYVLILWENHACEEESEANNVADIDNHYDCLLEICDKSLASPNTSISQIGFQVLGDMFLLADSRRQLQRLVKPSYRNNFRVYFKNKINYFRDNEIPVESPELIEVFLVAIKAICGSYELNQALCAELLSHLGTFSTQIDSLLRQLMNRLKAHDYHALLSSQLYALQILWESNRSMVHDLAAKLVLTFVLDSKGISFLQLLRDGANIALHPSGNTLDFLNQALGPFIQRSPLSDVKKILEYVKQRLNELKTETHQETVKKFELLCERRIHLLESNKLKNYRSHPKTSLYTQADVPHDSQESQLHEEVNIPHEDFPQASQANEIAADFHDEMDDPTDEVVDEL